ncbi:EmrB/QacA subfamily drug resistance transporter [Scopulibacillus darangshiensis]|uniref:EmrB/QacA subfamily drug resistance transporter n=1 Tax=Scopulibacillus darangshiensis TaxID=442528 RepID=A0A4V2SN38_9BACL|nr:MFS transporter [Scopulibacillus darangshiensis]TCP29726.1 EmrB/QacA subfamily drug resistance transporter [Scopulibacillus darangshiensis]
MEKTLTRLHIPDYIVVYTAGVGMFLSTLDTGIINVALPTLVISFDSSLSVMTWTITLYTLALVGTIVIFGRLGDKYGRIKIYSLGLMVFMLASLLCGLSSTPGLLIACRGLQGIGAAMLQATAIAIITSTIPKDRQGSALGTLGLLLGLGPVLGPSIGGILISLGSWQWIFWINLPFAVIGLTGCIFLLKRSEDSRHSIKLDLPGNLMLAFSILALLQGLSMLSTSNLLTLGSVVFFILLFAGFILWELRASQPILDLKLFRSGVFTAPIIGIFVLGGATSLGFIVPPYFLEKLATLEPWQVGLVNLSAPAGLMLLSKVSGCMMKTIGVTRLMVIGLVIMSASYGVLSLMQAAWSPVLIAMILLVYGIGAGLFIPANTSAIMGSAGQTVQGTIGAVQRMVQNLGIAIFSAIAAAVIRAHSHQGTTVLMDGFREAWAFAAISLAFSLFVFIFVYVRKRKMIG